MPGTKSELSAAMRNAPVVSAFGLYFLWPSPLKIRPPMFVLTSLSQILYFFGDTGAFDPCVLFCLTVSVIAFIPSLMAYRPVWHVPQDTVVSFHWTLLPL